MIYILYLILVVIDIILIIKVKLLNDYIGQKNIEIQKSKAEIQSLKYKLKQFNIN